MGNVIESKRTFPPLFAYIRNVPKHEAKATNSTETVEEEEAYVP